MIKKIALVLIILLAIGLLNNFESTYTRKAKVIDNKNGFVTCIDETGNIWEYKGSARVGDNLTLIMHDNHTTKITDDIIKGVKS